VIGDWRMITRRAAKGVAVGDFANITDGRKRARASKTGTLYLSPCLYPCEANRSFEG